MSTIPEEFDSIFRYIIVAARRAEQLMMGAKPRIETKHTKPAMIAKEEVDRGLVKWHVLTPEEIEAQRQAMVEQYRAEVEAEAAAGPARPIPDVLPTEEAGPVESETIEKDAEVERLTRLLGLAGSPIVEDDAGEAAVEADEDLPAEEPDEDGEPAGES